MTVVAALCGIALIVVVLWESFETIILPRRVTRRFRLTHVFYRSAWLPWAKLTTSLIPPRRQETWLSFFGPLSILILLGLWAGMMIFGFALLQWANGSAILTKDGNAGFVIDLYMSGTTFFTLGMGDAIPKNSLGRFLVVLESGMGLGFLALLIAYLPALNQSFSRREMSISLLDARAGSPPTASEIFRRQGHENGMDALRQFLREWEQWSAELLEGHLSYPVLAYFRSQHENQSWLSALTAILDTSAMAMAGVEGVCRRQAELTFAMARHALVDLSIIFWTKPEEGNQNRLPPEKLAALKESLAAAGINLKEGGEPDLRLTELRWLYEPYVEALASYFRFRVPPWIAQEDWVDNWQASTWERRTFWKKPSRKTKGEHF